MNIGQPKITEEEEANKDILRSQEQGGRIGKNLEWKKK
jgi:hypothetical protein